MLGEGEREKEGGMTGQMKDYNQQWAKPIQAWWKGVSV